MSKFYTNSIPSAIVDNVVKVVEVYQMMLKESQATEKKNVILADIQGRSTTIDRATLINNFRTLDGKKIRLLTIRYDKKYTIMRMHKTDCIAVYIPEKCNSQFIRPNGTVVPHGVVLVLEASKVPDSNAEVIDMSEAKEINVALFRKIFSIVKLSPLMSERLHIAREETERTNVSEQAEAAKNSKDWRDDWAGNMDAEAPRDALGNANAGVISTTDLYATDTRAVAVSTLVDEFGRVAGYRLRVPNGKEGAYSLNEVAALAKEGKVANIKFVEDKGGYLAGVGCKLKELPTEPF